MTDAHGRLFDQFSARASHAHGGSYFDAGFGHRALTDAHGRLHDLFGVPRDSAAHGERFDEFGWKAMPAIHGQQFDSDFKQPTAHDGSGHGTWFDEFRGGAQVRFMLEGADYEGTVIECNREFATVRSHDGQTHHVGLSQFLAYRTPTQEQASPVAPPSSAEAPSAHSADAHGAFPGDRKSAPTDMPPVIQEAPQGQYTEPRSGMPDGLMDTFTHLKSLADELDVEKISVGGRGCPSCGHDTFKIPDHGSAKVVTCNGCGKEHRFSDVAGHTITRPPAPTPGGIRKSVDATETAAQGAPTRPVGHRANCPRGGSAPCGASVDEHCSKCNAEVHDHEALGKTGTGDLGIDVPEREHKSTDHHSSQTEPGRCPHCGQALAAVNEATAHGQPSRKDKQGHAATFDTVSHKCMGTALTILKTLTEA